MKKKIAFILTFVLIASFNYVKAQTIKAVNDRYYIRINVCPTVLSVKFNDIINLGSTKLVQTINTLPNDNVIIDSFGVIINYCWTGPYIKSRSFDYVLFQDTTGTGIGIYDTANIYIDFANIDSVYPGDYNKDGVVNNFDLLGLGLNFKNHGLYRYGGASSTFTDHYGQDWDTVIIFNSDPINSKYADFNGSGRADSNDLFTYYQNYNLTYKPPVSILPSTNGPILKVVNTSTQDTFYDGNIINLNIVLGDSLTSIDSICGIAYTLSYDSTCIAPNFGDTIVHAIYNTSNNFFISLNNHLFSNIETKLNREIESVIVNNDKIAVSGFGDIGSIIVVLDDYIDGNIKLPGTYPLSFELKNILAIKNDGTRIPIQSSIANFYYKKTGVNIVNVLCESIQLFPNPVIDELLISNSCSANNRLKIIDIMGQIVDDIEFNSLNYNYSVRNLASGIYQVIITSNGTYSSKRIIISK